MALGLWSGGVGAVQRGPARRAWSTVDVLQLEHALKRYMYNEGWLSGCCSTCARDGTLCMAVPAMGLLYTVLGEGARKREAT